MRLYIVRHAEPVHAGGLDRPLSHLGWRQARATGELLGGQSVVCLYTSPFRRTLETVAGIRAALPVRTVACPGLCEWFVPDEMESFQGMSVARMQAEFPFLACPPEMTDGRWWPDWPETETDVDRRAAEAVAGIFDEWAGTETAVAIVAHGASCKGALRAALSPIEWPGEDVGHDHCGVSLVEGPEPGACRLIFQNRTDHRPSE